MFMLFFLTMLVFVTFRFLNISTQSMVVGDIIAIEEDAFASFDDC